MHVKLYPRLSHCTHLAQRHQVRRLTTVPFFVHNRLARPQSAPKPAAHSTAVFAAAPDEPQRRDVLAGYRETAVLTPRRLLKIYGQLSKARLTVLMTLSAMASVALSPFPTTLPVLLGTTVGTALCSASANTFNQIQEVPLDAQMARTRSRPLVRRAISPAHATAFGLATGIAGPAVLWLMTNPTTAILGAANIGLYAGAYTYLKRTSVSNTWVGAVVGGIPPLMGWMAGGGNLWISAEHPVHLFLPSFITSVPSIPLDMTMINGPVAPLALFLILYSWQFPHFNSLSYFVRESYAQAGYHMLSVTNPRKNALVSLRHALFMIPICSVLTPLSGLTTWAFALTSLAPNAIFARAAWRYWRTGAEKEARVAFQHSLWYLPVILGLMMVHKQGTDWAKWVGIGDASEDEDEKEQKMAVIVSLP